MCICNVPVSAAGLLLRLYFFYSLLRAIVQSRPEYAHCVKSVEYTPEKRYAGVKILFKPPTSGGPNDAASAKREVCVWVCASVYVCVCVCMRVRVRVWMRVCMCVCECLRAIVRVQGRKKYLDPGENVQRGIQDFWDFRD